MKAIRLTALLAALDSRALTPEASITTACDAIAADDGRIGAFVRLAPSQTRTAALSATGPLSGVPLGVKDIFDTADMATEYGSPVYAGHRPPADAALVAMARRHGAFIAGKTATTEFAHMKPAATRNPHNLAHTPGGSSSGSAAAVAAGMVAGAFGSQTAGSVIRPAAFCGIAGYKPSFRLLPTVGMKTFAWSLDTAGLFAAGVADVALLAALLTGRDLAVPATPLGGLRIGLYRARVDDLLTADMRAAVATAARRLEAAGAVVADLAEPAALSEAREAQRLLQDFEAALSLGHEHRVHRGALSPQLQAALDSGAATSPDAYDAARRTARHGRKAATGLFDDFDALLVPSAPGAAPPSLETTGDPAMNRLWTLTGNPCVNVPGLATAAGMPLGLTIVTRFGRDRDALAIGAHLEALLADGDPS